MKKLILIIVYLLFFASCKKQITEPLPPKNIDSLTIIFFGIVNQDSIFANQAEVKLDNASKYWTDKHGKCNIQNLQSGYHNIKMIDSNFYALDTNINISSSGVLNITLLPKVADFFPLHLGNTWKYRVHSYSYLYEDKNIDTYGIIYLKVDSIKYLSSTKYVISENRIDTTFTVIYPGMESDTTYGQSSGYFSLITEERNRLKAINFIGTVSFRYFSSGGLYSRYFPDSTNELTFYEGFYDGPSWHYTLRKNVGLISYSYYSIDFYTGNKGGVDFDLLSYEFPNK